MSKGEGEKTQEQQAALIAALIGSSNAGETLANATDNFRALPLDTLTREELAKNQPDPEMNKKTVDAKLRSVDAFVSHSWSDDGNTKYDELQEWADGKQKLIWLDKVRDQTPFTA